MPVPVDSFVGLTADQYAGVEALRQYAEFWKIPNKLVDDTALLDVNTIFSSGRPRHAFDGKTIVISPSGVEDATRIALVIADEDGVVIWPKEHIDELLAKAEAKFQQDNARLAQLQGGS